jgi:phosphoribosylformylglycinamidine synthase PurS subunit
MKIRIYITLKKAVLDIQGKAIENSLVKNLGFSQISNVRQGKLVEIDINETDAQKIEEIVAKLCDQILVNKVIENYTFEVVK